MSAHTVLPAEWAPQSAILITWPHRQGDWQPWLEQADHNFTELAVRISQYQALLINCYDINHQTHIRKLLAAAGGQLDNVRFYVIPSNDVWARDHGPITVYQDGKPVLLDFRFNGWGSKFPYDLDDQITTRLHATGTFGNTPLTSIDLILEGGSIESDGKGTLLTTSRCLLSPQRNPLQRPALERRLKELLGVERFLWLSHGHLIGDDTDGHIDTLARFCDPETIAYQSCQDPADPHFSTLQAMAEELKTFRTAAGTPYRLVPLPLPTPITDEEGQRLPAGYANFLIMNAAVLVPTYGDPADALALQQLRQCFAGRTVLGVSCRTLIRQFGSLHCVTMQLPVGVYQSSGT